MVLRGASKGFAIEVTAFGGRGQAGPGRDLPVVGHGQRAAEGGTLSTAGVQALVVARDDEFTDELRQGREDMEDQHPHGVVVSKGFRSKVKPMPRLHRPDTITMRP